MRRGQIGLLIAVIIIVTAASILVVSTVMDPISGLPADLRGRVSVSSAGQLSIHGTVSPSQWQEIQDYIIRPPRVANLAARWELDRTDSYSTARYVYGDGTLPVGDNGPSAANLGASVRTLISRSMILVQNGVTATVGAIAKAAEQASSWILGLFTLNARAAVSVDSTTTGTTSTAAPTCTTTQTAASGDSGVIVLLTEDGNSGYSTVTYGSQSLALITNAIATGGTNPNFAHVEIWGFAGTIPSGSQTMTATLSANKKQTCATILLKGVTGSSAFINGAAATGSAANPSITLGGTVAVGDLGFAVLGIFNAAPTAVNAPATSLYGLGAGVCGGTNSICGAGADIGNPATSIGWTAGANTWAIASIEVVQATCGTGSANCYRIGTGGVWSDPTLWSNSSGGPACGCTPSSTDLVFFNSTPTGTTTLAAATIASSIDMTGYTGTLDTTTSNYSLLVNGNVTIQGTLLARGSAIAVTGNVVVLGATTVVTMASSSWTVNGTWTNNSTSSSWSAGASSVTLKDAASGTLTFAALASNTNEFNNLTLDASVVGGLTYTMATNGLRMGGTLTIQNSTASATGSTILDTSASNLALTVGALTLSTLGAAQTRASTIAVNGAVNLSAANAYLINTGGTWTVTGAWTNTTTSASWSFAAAIKFSSAASQTMTLCGTACPGGIEFLGNVTFDSSVAAGVTYTMASHGVRTNGALLIQNSIGSPTGNTVLDTSASNFGITAASVTIGTNGTVTANAAAITVNGSWTATAANATFNAGTSTVSFGAAGTVTMTQSFYALTVTGGTVTAGSAITAANAMTVLGGTFAKSSFTLSVASLTLSGGALTSTAGNGSVTGNVNISSAASYIAFGSEAWTVSGSWTNASTSASWSAGTSSVTFNASTSQTMTFAGTNLAGNEFNNLTLNSGANAVTFTMATRALRWGGTLTVQGAAGTTTLTTANLGLTGGALTVGNSGVLTANASTVAVTNVTMTGGTSGTLSLTTGAWTVSGSWDTSGVGSSFTKGTSTVTMSGAATTLKTLNASNGFYGLTVSGTVSQSSAIDVSNALQTSGAGTLTTAGFNVTGGASLTLAGTGGVVASTSALTLGNVSVGAGTTLSFTSGTATIAGNWASNAGAFTAGTSTVTLTAAAPTVAVSGTAGFYNLTLSSGTAVTPASPVQVGHTMTINGAGSFTTVSGPNNYDLNIGTTGSGTSGNITVASGGSLLFTANGTMTVSGNWDSSAGTFTAGSSAITMTGAGKTLKIGAGQAFVTLSLTGGAMALLSFLATSSLTVSAGTLDLAGFFAFVNGNLALSGTGAVTFDSGSMTVTGNIVDTSATANSGSGTLVLPSSATQSVQGGVWPNVQVVGGEKDFTASLTTLNVTLLGNASVTIRVTAGVTWTLTPGGVLSGVSSTARLILTSSGTWTLNVSSVTGIAQWVAVDHSTATSPGAQGFNSLDNGGNTNWTFPSGAAPLGPFLTLLQHDPVIQLSISALGLVSVLAVRRYYKKTVTCPVCGHKFTEEGHEHE